MTLKGTWTLYEGNKPVAQTIEVHTLDTGEEDPVFRGGWDVMEFKYASGMERYIPWANLREARWEPAE